MGNTNKSKDNSDINQLAADNAQSMISKTLSGLNSNPSRNNNLGSKNYQKIIISYPDSSEELDILPLEVWNEILFLINDKTLAKIIPCVSRLLYHFSSADSDIWRRKCEHKYEESHEMKTETLTWKDLYLMGTTRFFPLFGFTMGKTTYSEIRTAKGASDQASGGSRYVCINGVNFWIDSAHEYFSSMYICVGIYAIPKEWEAKGLTWDKSFNEYKEWCKNTFRNYKVTERPHYTLVQGRHYFTAFLETIVKEPRGVLYAIKLEFNYKSGDETTKETLYRISVISCIEDQHTPSKESYEERFFERKCVD